MAQSRSLTALGSLPGNSRVVQLQEGANHGDEGIGADATSVHLSGERGRRGKHMPDDSSGS